MVVPNLRSNINNKNIRRTWGHKTGGYIMLGEIDPDKPLVMADGIETALALSQITGYPAISVVSAGNFDTVIPPPCSEIIIGVDNDESRTGRKKAESGAARLSKQRLVRLAEIPERPDEYDGAWKDWNDVWGHAKGDAEGLAQLREMVIEAEKCKGGPIKDWALALTMQEFLDLEVPPIEYHLEPWLQTESLAMVHAQRGVGKTRFTMSVAYTVANGDSMLGWKAGRAARVLYVDGELPTKTMQMRMQHLGPYTPNLLMLSRNALWRSRRLTIPDLGTAEGLEFLDHVIEAHKAELIILDSLSMLIRSGIEHDAESWAPIQDWLLRHRDCGRTIILLHHEGRSGKPRGTSKREDPLDTIIQLKEISDYRGGRG